MSTNWVRKSAALVAVIASTAVPVFCSSARAVSLCPVHVVVHADGSIEFDGTRVADDAKLTALLVQYRKQNPKCSMHIAADGIVRFEAVGRVILAMQKAGFAKVGFLTEPPL